MTERLIAKLDRLGAEAGIKEMTPEIYRFAQLLNDDKLKQWDEWRAKREWVGLEKKDMPDGENPMFDHEYFIAGMVFAAKVLKEKNT